GGGWVEHWCLARRDLLEPRAGGVGEVAVHIEDELRPFDHRPRVVVIQRGVGWDLVEGAELPRRGVHLVECKERGRGTRAGDEEASTGDREALGVLGRPL